MRWISLAIVLVSTFPAYAESPAEREAREHYTAGQKLFDQARYGDALAEFQQSYALSKYPALIYKIALCQDQLGRSAEALESYEGYLKADPQTSRRAGVEERITKLRELLHPAAPWPPGGAATEQPGSTAQPTPSQAQSTAAPQPQSSTSAQAAVRTVGEHPSKSTPVYKKWWLWTIVGVAAVGAAVGIGIGVTASQQSSFNPTLPPIGPAALRF